MQTSATVLPAGGTETGTTDETYVVGNDEFLTTDFGDGSGATRPVFVSFDGDPTKVAAKSWSGRPWQADPAEATGLLASANNYFSLATFRPDEAGQYRRQKTRLCALHAIRLDDVGTKVALERLTLPPTWLLETSPCNHQAGYLLREPLADGAAADRLMNAVVAAGLCDPGANGPRARLARLPAAVNGKHTPPFPCRLVEWRPELRYSIEELVDGLELDMAPAGRPQRVKARAPQAGPVDGDPVWMPHPDENSMLVALRNRGLYKAPLGNGKHDITCPWVQEHTGAADGGSAYFEPDDSWPIGGFKCLHGHCAERHVRDLLRFVDVEVGDARMKPTIRVVAGEIHRVVDAVERELAWTVDQAARRAHRRRPALCARQRPSIGGSLAGGIGFSGFAGSCRPARAKCPWPCGRRQRLRPCQPRWLKRMSDTSHA